MNNIYIIKKNIIDQAVLNLNLYYTITDSYFSLLTNVFINESN